MFEPKVGVVAGETAKAGVGVRCGDISGKTGGSGGGRAAGRPVPRVGGALVSDI